jgi:ABC-2 type transport system permease protein
MAVAIAGVMVPAASLVQEREQKSLDALLITPVTIGEVLLAKGVLGFVLATLTGVMTLVMNGLFGVDPWALTIAVMVGSLMMVEIGLVLGSWSRDTNTLFTVWKSGALVLLFPVVFYMWPTLPQWVAKLGPTYWFLDPVFRISVDGGALGDVWPQLLIGLGICLGLVPIVVWSGRALEVRLAIGHTRPSHKPHKHGAAA